MTKSLLLYNCMSINPLETIRTRKIDSNIIQFRIYIYTCNYPVRAENQQDDDAGEIQSGAGHRDWVLEIPKRESSILYFVYELWVLNWSGF